MESVFSAMSSLTTASNTSDRRASSSAPVVVSMGEFRLSRDPDGELVAYTLGSCLGVTFYDPQRRIGGILHAMLPSAHVHKNNKSRPTVFVDTGVQCAIDELRRAGADVTNLQCKVFGGAQAMEAGSLFRNGTNNSDMFCQVSREYELQVVAWEISGRVNRTIRLLNQNGDVLVKIPNREDFIR
jgi:chemotaxis protein CheD